MISQTVFVTGTGTGSGKTVLTSLILQYLRTKGIQALGMKPVCTGLRDDIDLIQSIQGNEFSDEMINPFYYKKPVAPAVASRGCKIQVSVQGILKSIKKVGENCETLLVEGAGGLMVPLNEQGHTWADLLKRLRCPVIVAVPNELGAINHTLLTVDKLKSIGTNRISVSLINIRKTNKKNIPERTNYGELVKNLKKIPIIEVPRIGVGHLKKDKIIQGSKKIEKILAQILNTV